MQSSSTDKNAETIDKKIAPARSSEKRATELSAAEKAEMREVERVAEQAALDEEMRKRRERVKAWQESRTKQSSSEATSNTVAAITSNATADSLVESGKASDDIDQSKNSILQNEGIENETSNNDQAQDSGQPQWSLEDEDDDENAVDGNMDITDTTKGGLQILTDEALSTLPSVLASPVVSGGILEEETEKESAFNRIVSASKPLLPPSSSPLHPPPSPSLSVLTTGSTNTATAGKSPSLTATKSPANVSRFTQTTATATTSATPTPTLSVTATTNTTETAIQSEDDEDPLDAFMKSLLSPEEALLGDMSESESEAAFSPTANTNVYSNSVTVSSANISNSNQSNVFGSLSKSTTTKTNNSNTNNISNNKSTKSTTTANNNSTSNNNKKSDKMQINPFGSNFVTYEDILSGNLNQGTEDTDNLFSPTDRTSALTVGGDGKVHRAGWESDVPSSPLVVEDDIARDEREERERREFWEALKKATPAALSSSAGPVGSKTERGVVVASLASSSDRGGSISISMSSGSDGITDTADKDLVATEVVPEYGRMFAGEGDVVDEAEVEDKKKSALEIFEEQKKGKELRAVDHSTIEYIPIRKNLYIVPKALSKLTEDEVKEKREDLQIKVRGRLCPAPVDNWQQCGLSDRALQALEKHNIDAPFAIQKQAIPAIMCGRDVIAIAKTGSGKTLAFLLPLFRHIQDQPPLKSGEGPIGLIMAPSRELALQISREAKKFAKHLGLSVACIYGGAGVAEQIAELKRGADIVVCTPGRMIDILCMQAGKMVSFKRVSYVVMDEADRMFDMGFEPQIKMIIQNIRPDRQTVLFSATFPKQIEKLAKAILRTPLEIVVGERSTVNKDITQVVEVHEEEDKFMRLLQLLGIWYERGSVLIFVDKQDKCDKLFHDLLKSGYPCLSLHGGHDQVDRDHTLHEFRQGIKTVMVATSAASRGLDIPEIIVVVNYNCPNHLEEYVHRVGRTGRAGRKGTAYTFISPNEDQYSSIMVKALEKAEQTPPQELLDLAAQFKEKVARGEAQYSNSGFGGDGFTFDSSEMNETQKIASLQRKQWEIEQGIYQDKDEAEYGDDDGDDEMVDISAAPTLSARGASTTTTNLSITETASSSFSVSAVASGIITPDSAAFAALPPLEKAQMMAKYLASKNALPGAAGASITASSSTAQITSATGTVDANAALARARQLLLQMAAKGGAAVDTTDSVLSVPQTQTFIEEVEINDYPPQVCFIHLIVSIYLLYIYLIPILFYFYHVFRLVVKLRNVKIWTRSPIALIQLLSVAAPSFLLARSPPPESANCIY